RKAPPRTIPLSDKYIRNAKPQVKAYKLSDFDGLFLLVNPSGSKLWRMKYRVHGKEKLLSVGKYPDVSLADARRMKEEARSALAAGRDPGAEKQERKRAERNRLGATSASQAEAFIEKARMEGRAKSTLDKTEWLIGMATDAFGSPIRSPPIDPFPQHGQLCRGESETSLGRGRPRKAPPFQNLVVEAEAPAIQVKEFDPVATPAPEGEHRPARRILA
ncbi:MAG: Arm DNA-binding domain-containing protein, partial [Desulfuromonadales bacterium]